MKNIKKLYKYDILYNNLYSLLYLLLKANKTYDLIFYILFTLNHTIKEIYLTISYLVI